MSISALAQATHFCLQNLLHLIQFTLFPVPNEMLLGTELSDPNMWVSITRELDCCAALLLEFMTKRHYYIWYRKKKKKTQVTIILYNITAVIHYVNTVDFKYKADLMEELNPSKPAENDNGEQLIIYTPGDDNL